MIYHSLKKYLRLLGMFEGETPHGLRGGCAVTMLATGAAQDVVDLKAHIGWRSDSMPHRYARADMLEGSVVSKRFRHAVDEAA